MSSEFDIKNLQEEVWNYYHNHTRSMPWRDNHDPYWVVVSEVMLQQTQVSRVLPKFEVWVKRFPDWQSLAAASLGDALREWQGLGYNRRGRWLHQLAQIVVSEHQGKLPEDPAELVKLPGIGPNTAGSIAAFAFNQPIVFIETNIRRVFIHHFFADEEGISDKQLLPLIKESLNPENPREWYYALMDYGAYLSKQVPNPNRRSKHYARQSQFEGSNRQLRAQVLRHILEHKSAAQTDIEKAFAKTDPAKINSVLRQYLQENLLKLTEKNQYTLVD